MRELTRAGSGHPAVRQYAEEAVEGVHPRDLLGQVIAVRDRLGADVEYRRDPVLDEWLQTPWYVVQCQIWRGRRPQLDCDDLTTLSTGMLGSIGFPVAHKVISNRADRRYNHVYGLVRIGPQWTALDMTRLWAHPESLPARETRAKILPVIGEPAAA